MAASADSAIVSALFGAKACVDGLTPLSKAVGAVIVGSTVFGIVSGNGKTHRPNHVWAWGCMVLCGTIAALTVAAMGFDPSQVELAAVAAAVVPALSALGSPVAASAVLNGLLLVAVCQQLAGDALQAFLAGQVNSLAGFAPILPFFIIIVGSFVSTVGLRMRGTGGFFLSLAPAMAVIVLARHAVTADMADDVMRQAGFVMIGMTLLLQMLTVSVTASNRRYSIYTAIGLTVLAGVETILAAGRLAISDDSERILSKPSMAGVVILAVALAALVYSIEDFHKHWPCRFLPRNNGIRRSRMSTITAFAALVCLAVLAENEPLLRMLMGFAVGSAVGSGVLAVVAALTESLEPPYASAHRLILFDLIFLAIYTLPAPILIWYFTKDQEATEDSPIHVWSAQTLASKAGTQAWVYLQPVCEMLWDPKDFAGQDTKFIREGIIISMIYAAGASAVWAAERSCVVMSALVSNSVGRGNPRKPTAALTFNVTRDTGLEALVDSLEDAGNAKATFFVSRFAAGQREALVQAVDAGHELGILGKARDPDAVADAAALADELEQLTGKRPLWYRPGNEAATCWEHRAANDAGFGVALWSINPCSWDGEGWQVAKRVSECAVGRDGRGLFGAIVLLTAERGEVSREVATETAAALEKGGVQAVTLSTLQPEQGKGMEVPFWKLGKRD